MLDFEGERLTFGFQNEKLISCVESFSNETYIANVGIVLGLSGKFA